MNAARSSCAATDDAVNLFRPFMPEELTPLSYTPVYCKLTPEQRLRYNHLHALYFNEQIMFFEVAVGCPVLEALLRQTWPGQPAEELRKFLEEERRHTEMFRRLNKRCAPQLYGAQDFFFIQASGIGAAALRATTRRPRLFPLFLWLMLLQEERSLFYAKEFIRQRQTVEPHFVEAHRAHLADEVGHASSPLAGFSTP
jgi:hypothetical protein